MLQSTRMRYEKPIHGTNVGISIHANWRLLPPVLHTLKANNCSIHKAKYWDEWTSMYIKTPHQFDVTKTHELLSGSFKFDKTMDLYSPGLPFNTCIHMYNISTCPYTILDFGCYDRTGLLCEIIEVLSKYDIEIKGAYINTIGNAVSNIFYITHSNAVLNEEYMEYMRNCLESNIRVKDTDSY